jgi:hypothetical protein
METRDVSFIPKKYRKLALSLSKEQYQELLFEWASHMECLCGNGAPAGNYWMSNEWDNCMKILEDDR